MALISCHECSGPVSSEAKACPGCGAKPTRPRKSRALLYAVLGAPVIFVTWIAVGAPGHRTSHQYKMGEAITDCREQIERAVIADASIKQACDFMESDYRARYGEEPR